MPAPVYIPPAGVSAVSAWEDGPTVSVQRPPGILADDIDPATGELHSILRGADPVDAAIAWQFSIRFRAGPLTYTRGNKLGAILYNDDAAPRAAQFEAARIMKPFVDRGEASDVVVKVTAGPGAGDMGAIVVEYVNVRSNTRQSVRLGGL